MDRTRSDSNQHVRFNLQPFAQRLNVLVIRIHRVIGQLNDGVFLIIIVKFACSGSLRVRITDDHRMMIGSQDLLQLSSRISFDIDALHGHRMRPAAAAWPCKPLKIDLHSSPPRSLRHSRQIQ